MVDETKPMDEEEKKKKSKFSFLRMIGLGSDSNTQKQESGTGSNKFYVGNVQTDLKNRKKKLDEITGN